MEKEGEREENRDSERVRQRDIGGRVCVCEKRELEHENFILQGL